MKTMNDVEFSKDPLNIMSKIIEDDSELEVQKSLESGITDGIVLMSKRKFETIQEELHLHRTGTMAFVHNAMDTSTDEDLEEI